MEQSSCTWLWRLRVFDVHTPEASYIFNDYSTISSLSGCFLLGIRDGWGWEIGGQVRRFALLLGCQHCWFFNCFIRKRIICPEESLLFYKMLSTFQLEMQSFSDSHSPSLGLWFFICWKLRNFQKVELSSVNSVPLSDNGAWCLYKVIAEAKLNNLNWMYATLVCEESLNIRLDFFSRWALK